MPSKQVKQGYVSEFTHFINGLIDQQPELVEDQRRGRAMYWDKPVDLGALDEAREDSVPVDSYYYYGNPWPPMTASERAAAPRLPQASPN